MPASTESISRYAKHKNLLPSLHHSCLHQLIIKYLLNFICYGLLCARLGGHLGRDTGHDEVPNTPCVGFCEP